LDDWGLSPDDWGILLFAIAYRRALRTTQPPTQWVPGFLSSGVKWLGREDDYSPPPSAKIKNAWSYTSATPMSSLHCA